MTACPCDEFDFPARPVIPAGLPWLPRQTVSFPTARRHMLSLIPHYPALQGWRARDGDDLGLMLLEMWATLLDNLSFYDRELAQELYLGTARRRESLRRITEGIGYRPRPATAASATLAVQAAGVEPTLLPAGVAFRSDSFDGEPAQVFELASEFEVHPVRNAWTVEAVRDPEFVDDLLLRRGDQSPAAGDVVVVQYGEPSDSDFSLTAIRVAASEAFEAPDGEVLTRVLPEEPYLPAPGTQLSRMRIRLLTQTAHPTAGTSTPGGLILDSVYPQIQPKDVIVIENTDFELSATRVASVATQSITLNGNSVPATLVTPDATPAGTFARLHFATVPLGAPLNPAATTLTRAQLDGPVALRGVNPDLDGAPGSGRLLIKGEGDLAYELPGSVSVDSKGRATASLDGSVIEEALRTEVRVHGNLLDLIRGETVHDEVLGVADSKVAFQEFTLKKSPLTFVTDASLPSGIRPELEVRVDGILWTRIDTLADAGPDDEIYIVRIDDDEVAHVRFGDLVRPASGARISATYRHGAGAARPPLGAIGKVVGNDTGLDRVFWSLEARGGSDREAPDAIRDAAPAATLTLGRAVSLPDFEAIAASYPGVVTAAADMAWSTARHRVAVTAWIVSDGASVAADLAAYLSARSDPEILVEVVEARPIPAALGLEVIAEPGHSADQTKQAVWEALDPAAGGFLAPAQLGIGSPFFRSALVKAIHAVASVGAIRSLVLRPPGEPVGLRVPPGRYLDFGSLSVEASS